MKRLRLTLGFLGLAAVSTIALAAPPQFVVTKLSDPVIGMGSAVSLSESGQVLLSVGQTGAYVWTSGFGFHPIPFKNVIDLNSSGVVLGMYGNNTAGTWNSVAGWQPLPLTNVRPAAINDLGTVLTTDTAARGSLLFDADGGTRLAAGVWSGNINNSDVLIGAGRDSHGASGVTVMWSDAMSSPLPLIPPGLPPGTLTQATAINNRGQGLFGAYVGSQGAYGPLGNFLYTPSDGLVHDIPLIAPTLLSCVPGPCTMMKDLNDAGWMLGDECSHSECSTREPFLRTNDTYYELRNLVHPASLPVPISLESTGQLYAIAMNDAGQIVVNSYSEGGGAFLLTPVGRPLANQITSPMSSETALVAGQTVHATASGTDVTWTVDRIHDGVPEYATGTGSEFTFTVPADSTTQQRIVLTATSSEGKATVTYPIAATAGAHITEPSPSAKVRPGETVTLRGTGGHVHWAVDRIYDGAGDFAQGAGDEFSFTVPVDSTAAQYIRITLTSDAGTATRDIPIEQFSVVYPPISIRAYPQIRALPGTRSYSDRNYVIDYLSPNLAGGIAIQTANDDKFSPSGNLITMTFSANAYLYVIQDSRISGVPQWLSDSNWQLTGESYISAALPVTRVYRRPVSAGQTLTIGGNNAAPASILDLNFVSNYAVIVQPR